MEDLITSYGIEFIPFKLTLKQACGTVTGSSALAAYLKQEGIEPGFKPNDLDIFVPGHLQHAIDSRGHPVAGQFEIRTLKLMKNFLVQYGFTENDKFNSNVDQGDDDTYYSTIKRIQKVTSFTNKDNMEIQVIVIDTYDIVNHITAEFDISACVSWYDSNDNRFMTLNPYTTKRKEMYYLHSETDEKRLAKTLVRAVKYGDRGFKLIDKPCPFIDMRDTRDQLSHKKFDNIEAMDIFTLDEMPIRDYLQKSEWNIVLKAGETYYAFERRALMDYMKKKATNIGRIGQVCETPFNQCITLEGYHQLTYADYSIYELKHAYSVPTYGGRVKSLFNLGCYSINDWIAGTEGGLVQMPPEHLATTPMKRVVRRQPVTIPVPAQTHEISVDDIMAAHAHLLQPGNLEAFHAAILASNATQ
jgi:hypothetical protein